MAGRISCAQQRTHSSTLLDHLAFYGAYHRHPINQIIHFFFVPAIAWSAAVWLALLGPLLPASLWDAVAPPCAPPPNAAGLVLAAYSAAYVRWDAFAGASWALCIALPMWASASAFAATVPHAALWALAVHALGWYMQIHPGHAVFERRKPALLDSLSQALTSAPLFCWFEALFLLGYRPALRAQLRERVDAAVAVHKAKTGSSTGSW